MRSPLLVGFSNQDDAMNAAQSTPQRAHYHVNWKLRRELGANSAPSHANTNPIPDQLPSNHFLLYKLCEACGVLACRRAVAERGLSVMI